MNGSHYGNGSNGSSIGGGHVGVIPPALAQDSRREGCVDTAGGITQGP